MPEKWLNLSIERDGGYSKLGFQDFWNFDNIKGVPISELGSNSRMRPLPSDSKSLKHPKLLVGSIRPLTWTKLWPISRFWMVAERGFNSAVVGLININWSISTEATDPQLTFSIHKLTEESSKKFLRIFLWEKSRFFCPKFFENRRYDPCLHPF